MDEVEFVDVQKICVLQCSALITTYIDMCIYIYFLHRYWYSMHALHCITHLWMLTQTCAKQNWICLKTWFFISQNSTKSEGNFLKTTAFQTFKMSRNQSFSAVKSGGTRRRSAARHLHACETHRSQAVAAQLPGVAACVRYFKDKTTRHKSPTKIEVNQLNLLWELL